MRARIVAAAVFAAACGGKGDAGPPPVSPAATPLSAEISELELRADGVDRFASCPPPGDLGQPWVPSPPPWTPPPGAPNEGAAQGDVVASDRTRTEAAVEATHRDFRSCQRRALVRGASPDGHVAIVMRVAPDGRVAKAEEYAACEIAPEAIMCMMQVATRLRFAPPGPSGDTVVVPATFTGREGMKRRLSSRNDAYTASAYLTIESARPLLHACEEAARTDGRPVMASGTFILTIAADGRVVRTQVEPWTGARAVIDCATRVLAGLRFASPEDGKGFVVARLNFNPRQAAR